MAKNSKHIQQWKHNRNLISILPQDFPDWIVTVTFYTALHAVDALLAKDGISITSHEVRNNVLVKTRRYLATYKAYQPLYNLSRTIRYLAEPSRWIPADNIQANVIEGYLYKIEKSVLRLLKTDLRFDAICLQQTT